MDYQCEHTCKWSDTNPNTKDDCPDDRLHRTHDVEDDAKPRIYVTGEVTRPGNYPLEQGSGVLQALASAGGFTPYSRKDIYVVRATGKPKDPSLRLRFEWAALFKAEGKGTLFVLRPGDVVMVE